jgi:signal transduction histidine kinase/CheY-like chemotaxis protein
MNQFKNDNNTIPTVEELQKENRAIKRKLSLLEANLSRARQVSSIQKQVENSLAASLEKELQFFKLILENAPGILLLLDFDGRFAYASDSFLKEAGIANFGLISGRHYRDVLQPIVSSNSLLRLTEAIDSASAQKDTISLEEKFDFYSQNLSRTFSILVTPMIGEDGKSTGIMVLFNDITKINDAMELAKSASTAKTSFLANMSHEIRTPMNAIIGMTSIGMETEDHERMNYCLSRIDSAAKHLLGIINDILDMSKIEANKLELSPVSFEFDTMLKNVVNIIDLRIKERRQKFYVTVDNHIPNALIGDDQRLIQIITNLLSNAVKFTPEEGIIHLDIRLLPDEDKIVPSDEYCRIQVSVSDTGIGLTDEQKVRLFYSFEQADAGTSRKYGGTGLGLAISKSLIEMMSGEIQIESEVGHGAKFIFTAVLKRGEKVHRPHLANNINLNELRIFAVDDEPAILDFFINTAKDIGVDCTVASSGEEAVAMLSQDNDYNIYFLDWMLPGMSGTDLAQIIREKTSCDPIVAIFSSADWNHIEKDARKAGVDKLLPKPLLRSMVVDFINECYGSNGNMEYAKKEERLDFTGYTVLLAEDVEINREIVLALLAPVNLTIDCAENGIEALRMFKEAPEKYDLIFMDLQMPEMDGYEATRRIRALAQGYDDVKIPRAKEIPIVAMTANVFKEDIEKCLAAGMNSHLGKPLNVDDVIRLLQEYLPDTKPNIER